MTLAWWKIGLVPVLVLGGCLCAEGGPGPSTTSDAGIDSGPVDAGRDAGSDAGDDAGTDGGVDAGPRQVTEGVFQSAGGGAASSSSYRMRVSFGAPQPMGVAEGASKRLRAGPAAAGR